MKTSKILSAVALSILAAAGAQAETVGNAHAPAQPGKSRAEVKAELAEALRTGNILAPGESGLLLNQAYPNLYPAVPRPVGKSREEAKRELAQAIRNGEILTSGEVLRYQYEVRPDLYPRFAQAPRKTT